MEAHQARQAQAHSVPKKKMLNSAPPKKTSAKKAASVIRKVNLIVIWIITVVTGRAHHHNVIKFLAHNVYKHRVIRNIHWRVWLINVVL